MFMPEPLRCLSAVRAMLKPEGKICVACWRAPNRVPFMRILTNSLSRYMEIPKPDSSIPGFFRFADSELLLNLMEYAGFHEVTIEPHTVDMINVESGEEYWQIMSDIAAPLMAMVNTLSDFDYQRFVNDVVQEAEHMKQDGRIKIGGVTWLATGSK